MTLKELRSQLNNVQQKCINEMWNYYKEKNEWIKTRTLHQIVENKTIVLKALTKLGGSIVYETRGQYALTFLGVMLVEDFYDKEELLIKYLKYLIDRFISNPDIEKINSNEVKEGLNLTDEEINILKELILFGHYYGGTFSSNRSNNKWSSGIPTNIDDLTEINNLKTYVLNQIISNYNPAVPILEFDREKFFYDNRQTTNKTQLSFVKNKKLQDQLQSDWTEAQKNYNNESYKSTVILCGGIIEGILWDSLFNVTRSKNELKQKKLVDLVRDAKKHGIIGNSIFHLSNALREYRNLVHPTKHIEDNILIDKEVAKIALNAVEICMREVDSYFNKKSG